VIPKRLREELDFKEGQRLELSAVDGRLEVRHPATSIRLVERDGRMTAVADRPMPELTSDVVRTTLEQIRR
jgi:AbrB family looped-hinge helix DNA binding protein